MAERVNVLHIITKLELGGAQKNVLDILTGLDKSRYNLILISGTEGLLIGDALALKDVKVRLIESLRREINLFYDIITLYILFREIKKEKVTIVHTHSSKAGIFGRWAAKLARAPIIVHTIHGWSFNAYQGRFSKRLFIFLEKITAKITTKLIAVSESDIQIGLANHIGSLDKYELIRYGFDIKRFINRSGDVKDLRKEFNLRPNVHIVGTVAPFKPQKSPQDFVRVAHIVTKSLPNIKYIMIGDGSLRPEVMRLIEKLGLRDLFILTGWRRDVERLMGLLDVFVLTSLWEGLPLVLLEAMASAKAIVATSVGGNAEIIAEGVRGFLVSPGDIRTMGERIVRIFNDDKIRNEFGVRNRDFMMRGREFDISYMLNKVDSLYSHLVEQRNEWEGDVYLRTNKENHKA